MIEKAGSEVDALNAGDFVSAEMHVNCGHCHQCRVGEAHICPNVKIIGIDQDGAFAELVKIPASNIIKLDPAIPERYGAILDPLGNAVHTVLAGAIAGQTVLVTGCGPIGLMSIAVAKACGSSTVFATETNEHRRGMGSLGDFRTRAKTLPRAVPLASPSSMAARRAASLASNSRSSPDRARKTSRTIHWHVVEPGLDLSATKRSSLPVRFTLRVGMAAIL